MEDNSTRRQEHQWSPTAEPYPWLVYCHGNGHREQTFCNLLNPSKIYNRRIPPLRNKRILPLDHGWCLVFNIEDRRHLFLWNPVTLEKIELPTLIELDDRIGPCVLSSPPTETTTCTIMLFTRELPVVVFCRLGDEHWSKLDYENELIRCLEQNGEWGGEDDEPNLAYPIMYNGQLHMHTIHKRRLVIVEIKQKDCIGIRSLHVRYPAAVPYSTFRLLRFIEFSGDMYGIEMMATGINDEEVFGMEIRRLDFSSMVWEKIESAEDLVFFVNPGNDIGVCCPAIKPNVEGNRVFIPFGRQEKILYSYNIKDRSLSIGLPPAHLPKMWRPWAFWVMLPTHSANELGKTEFHKEEENIMGSTQSAQGREIREGNKDDVVDQEIRDFSNLPSDVGLLIAKRLILEDYTNFRATCGLFRSVAPPNQWDLVFNELPSSLMSPCWLMFLGKDSVCTFVDPVYHGNKYFMYLPKSLSGCIIGYSKHGFFLMSRGRDSTFYFDPFKREIIPLPNFPGRGIDTKSIAFSSSPTSSDCLLVEIYKWRDTINIKFARLDEEQWHSFYFDDDSDFVFYDNSPVFYNGAFYYLGEHGNLGVLQLDNEDQFNWQVLPEPQRPCSHFRQNFLVECEGELLGVFVGQKGRWVRVFSLNRYSMRWVRVKSLGCHMIFVSHSSTYSAVAKNPEMGNRIYFPRFLGQSGVVFYSLETNEYYTLDNKNSEIDFYSTREQLYCGWIEPGRRGS